jgi:hypothetical protein
LLLHIFGLIGLTNRICVEMAVGSPHGANTTNLICNWGFTGLLVDGDEELIRHTVEFYRRHGDTWIDPPRAVSAWITAENINDLIRDNGIAGEIDLFSLDLDGIDYWLWKKLDVIRPRVVVLEYQDIWGPDASVTVPYDPDFRHPEGSYDYAGASLAAMVKLGREKGYRLVGCNRYGFNAFFVRNDLGGEVLPEVPARECFKHPLTLRGMRDRLPHAQTFRWQEV